MEFDRMGKMGRAGNTELNEDEQWVAEPWFKGT